MNRTCIKCKTKKDIGCFHRNKPSLGGRLRRCKDCVNPLSKKYAVRRLYEAQRIFFGGNRKAVLERDNYRCVKCGMSDRKHRRKFNRSITIDHINGLGCYSKIRDNRMSNLQTLCLPCHGRKDVVNRKWRKTK